MATTKKTTKRTTKKSKTAKARKSKSASREKSKVARKSTKRKSAERSPETPKAVRLTFRYVGDQVKLVSQESVEMIVPPSDPVTGYKRERGFWAEVKSDRDRTLYRQVMHNPTRNDAEIFSEDQTISRAPALNRKGVFVVLIPDTEKSRDIVLARSSGPPAGVPRGLRSVRSLASAPAKEIARFKLKK